MFTNIGKKIKTLAKIMSGIGIIFSIGLGLVFMKAEPVVGLLIMALGSLVSWSSSFLTYGYGELLLRVSSIDESLKSIAEEEDFDSTKR